MKDLISLKGIGPKRAEQLSKLGIRNLNDLIFFIPRSYQDYSVITPIAALMHGMNAALKVRITSEPRLVFPRRGLSVISVMAQDNTGNIWLTWYNQPYQKRQIPVGETVIVCGKVDESRGRKLVNPVIYTNIPGILPIYPLTRGITQKQLREAIHTAIEIAGGSLRETLPARFRLAYGLCELNYAIQNIHFPVSNLALEMAKHRLVFEELIFFLLAIELVRQDKSRSNGIVFKTDRLAQDFCFRLPFSLTAAQKRVIAEISEDMSKPVQMNRIIQGDVGSGKTVLALYALFAAFKNGYQGVLMAPTEILAQQHYSLAKDFFQKGVCLLKGGMSKTEKDEAYTLIKNGEAKIIIGTHALIQENLDFYRLGLVVTDEQHRFGVRQRATIEGKGKTPDVLIMSATPIPRTLALILYGDLDVSVLDELPPGRKKVITKHVPASKRERMYDFIMEQIKSGRQAYVVCPLVEQSDVLEARSATDVYNEVKKGPLIAAKVGLLHGRMSAKEKTKAITNFVEAKTDVLVTTTVVEVGVDVPNATVIAIENADRFGLAQLHQLRGRVGRGSHESYCFLLSNSDSKDVLERLNILAKSDDGFEIARKDLEIRGPGDFLGTRQHGVERTTLAALADMDLINNAKSAVDILLKDPDWRIEKEFILQNVKERYTEKLNDITMN